MQYRPFGKLDFNVSMIGMGCASISGEGGGYGFGEITEQESIGLVHAAQDMGINLFDTAPIYGFGMSERRLGKALRGERRERAFVVSKCGITWDDEKKVALDNSAHTTRTMLETSLGDLESDYIDLYLVHWPDNNCDIRETVEVLVEAKEAGKIKAFGLSNSNPEELAKASEIAVPEVLQAQMNLFENYPRESLFDFVNEQSAGMMTWGSLDKGILTGRANSERCYDKSDVRSHAPWWINEDHTPRYNAMGELLPRLKQQGHTGLELALSHLFSYSEVSTALCGFRNRTQLEGNCSALDRLLSAELLEECRATAKRHVGG